MNHSNNILLYFGNYLAIFGIIVFLLIWQLCYICIFRFLHKIFAYLQCASSSNSQNMFVYVCGERGIIKME